MPTRRRDRRPPATAEVSGEKLSNLDASQMLHTEPSSKSALRRGFFSAVVFAIVSLFLSIYYIRGRSAPVPSVYDRGLVKEAVGYREILAEHSRASENRSRSFKNPVLAYITPWNSKGYDMAKLFSSKLTHLSPVWYDLKSEGKTLTMEGRHNVDLGWISEIRARGSSMVLPRVVLEAFPVELLQKKKMWTKAIDLIVAECKDVGYDGIVLESWSRWAAYGVLHDPYLRSLGLQFIMQLGNVLHSVGSTTNMSHHLELFYVIPAPHSKELSELDFGPQDLQQLSDAVDGFSLMTYDFSGPQNPGPNAPLKWIHSTMHVLLDGDSNEALKRAKKIFLGINFYGNDFVLTEGISGGGAITGREYINQLEKNRPALQWEEKSGEHYYVYFDGNARHAVLYPSLLSISMRLDEARAWGAAISIWEIGQGLDYFFDLL